MIQVFITSTVLNSQTFRFSTDFTAECSGLKSGQIESVCTRIENGKLYVDAVVKDQCCAVHTLEITDVDEGVKYLKFYDVTDEACDCMCDYDVTIDLGEFQEGIKKINFNGDVCPVLPQDYKPLIEVGKKWYESHAVVNPNVYSEPIVSIIADDDPQAFCWNGKFYHKVITTEWDAVITRYIREENGKVFELDQSGLPYDGCDEYLLYDFTVGEGDIVKVGPEETAFKVVQLENSEFQGRRVLGLYDADDPMNLSYTRWIEGVGDVRGLFSSYLPVMLVGVNHELICCTLGEEMLYRNDNYENCSVPTAISQGQESKIRIRSVSSKGDLVIEGIENDAWFRFEVFSMSGKILRKGKVNQSLNLNISAGVYLIVVYKGESQVHYQKIIIN